MMNQSVDGRECHGGVWEDSVPLPEGLIGRDEHGSPLVSCTDEFEEDARFSLILGDVGDVVEDQEVEFVQLRDGAFEDKIAPCLL